MLTICWPNFIIWWQEILNSHLVLEVHIRQSYLFCHTSLMKLLTIISKGSPRRSFCFFFSLERFPKSILVVWPREWYQINPQNIWNKRIEPIFDWRSQNIFWDLPSSLTVSFSHVWMSKWVKNGFRNFENPFLRSKNQIFFLTQ